MTNDKPVQCEACKSEAQALATNIPHTCGTTNPMNKPVQDSFIERETIEHLLTVIGTWATENEDGQWYTGESLDRAIKYTEEYINEALQEQQETFKKNIGQLRQWLNEDRIDDLQKLVTSEQLEHWLIK